ncbi:MAG: TRAP transporter small permease [Deltaproteobacteria bacterium]|nr:TRAP transporter small permease [Deltaproteobacteria bacterium]MBW1960905.1 TRAP transporter small permease [Deltaproteobacteria bacterium]MBW2152152.1 TRAP transporter small permease [Deltaproteobacteria bacterium]
MRKLVDGYYRLLKVLLASLMGLLMIPVGLQIFARYIGLIPRYIWTEEMARFCFIWIILIGSMIAVRDGTHFSVDLLPTPKTNRGKALANMFADFIVFLVALIFIVWGLPLVKFGLLQESEMAELPMVYIYSAWPVAGITWVIFLAEKLGDNIKLWRGENR